MRVLDPRAGVASLEEGHSDQQEQSPEEAGSETQQLFPAVTTQMFPRVTNNNILPEFTT